MAIFTVTTEGVTSLTITVLLSFLLTENVTSTHRHHTTAVRADFLMVSCVMIHAITAPTTVRSRRSSPVMANATKIKLKSEQQPNALPCGKMLSMIKACAISRSRIVHLHLHMK